MVLAHREQLTPRRSQADLARQRLRDYAESGKHPGNPPTPGVFARHNAVDTPALLPDGRPLEESISASLVARGQLRDGLRGRHRRPWSASSTRRASRARRDEGGEEK